MMLEFCTRPPYAALNPALPCSYHPSCDPLLTCGRPASWARVSPIGAGRVRLAPLCPQHWDTVGGAPVQAALDYSRN